MEHIAIDLGKRESQVCVRAADGSIVLERRIDTLKLEAFLTGRKPSRVVVETSSEAFGIAARARALGHDVRIVPATLVRTLGVGARKMKTDQRDARVLSEVSTRIELPSVHLPSESAQLLKSMCTAREQLIECRTRILNMLDGYLRTRLAKVPGGTPQTFAVRVRKHFEGQVQEHIEWMLQSLEALNAQIKAADKRIAQTAKSDPVCALLMTMPGVGPVTAVRLRGALDRADRFSSASEVASYLGLTPGENTTGFSPRRLGITKAGPAPVRRALNQAAWSLYRTRPADPMVLWAKGVEARSHRNKAIVALARKMAVTLWAMWRDGTVYSPTCSESISSSAA